MVDRRSFIASLVLAPLAIATPATAAILVCAESSPFEAALADYRHARAEYDRIAELNDFDTSKVAGSASDTALHRMLEVPARNVADVATKLEILMFEYEDCEMDGPRMALIAKDARRLAGETRT